MARLSAQCTDARVNIVSASLFQKYPTLESVAASELAELEEAIKPCGLYKTKAKSIRETAQILMRDFGGRVPDTMEELLSLPGVGRKIANLMLGDVFGQPTTSEFAAGLVFIRKAKKIRRRLKKSWTAVWKSGFRRISATGWCFLGGTCVRRAVRAAVIACSVRFAGTIARKNRLHLSGRRDIIMKSGGRGGAFK